MSLLLNKLPDTLTIGSEPYEIYSDFRTWIQIENALFWETEPMQKRVAKVLQLCFKGRFPYDFDAATRAMIEFYNRNRNEQNSVAQVERESEQGQSAWNNRLYSFIHDEELIFAAFLSQYNTNLNTADLHWWEFSAIFIGLEEVNRICKVMEYRGADLSAIKDKEQKAFYRRMKRLYRLPDPRTEEEKEAAMIDALAVMF